MLIVEKFRKNTSIDLLQYHAAVYGEDIIFSYKGALNQKNIVKMGQYLRRSIKAAPVANRKLFAVFVELAQNALLYSSEYMYYQEMQPIGNIVVSQTPQYYNLMTGNLTRNELAVGIEEKVKELNRYSSEELRALRIATAEQSILSQRSGGGVGLIKVAMLSPEPLECACTPINKEVSFLSFATKIYK